MSDSFLSQEEIDALLNQGLAGGDNTEETVLEQSEAEGEETLEEMERDALGEIGNISMGSAATALSQLLNQRVDITTPQVRVTTEEELYSSFELPYVIVEINFDSGLKGSNLLILKIRDAAVIANLMMGGDGTGVAEELSELTTSAVAEAMNQMIGSAATSMSEMFNKGIKISPPKISPVDFNEQAYDSPLKNGKIVVVSFKIVVGNLIDSELMQVIPLLIAKEEISLLLGGAAPADETAAPKTKTEMQVEEQEKKAGQFEQSVPEAAPEPSPKTSGTDTGNLDLILDVPLKVSVVLGRTKRPIGEVLSFASGSIVELEKLAEEPVEILVNGTLIARGEVVVVNENFGVRIKTILSPEERLNNLRGS